jgi:hypothetical protein
MQCPLCEQKENITIIEIINKNYLIKIYGLKFTRPYHIYDYTQSALESTVNELDKNSINPYWSWSIF